MQIGFAFHKDPSDPKITGNNDDNRFPKALGTFLFDLESSDKAGIRETLRKLHYGHVKVMVRFNLNYNHTDPNGLPGPNPAGPDSEKPELRFVIVPCAY